MTKYTKSKCNELKNHITDDKHSIKMNKIMIKGLTQKNKNSKKYVKQNKKLIKDHCK